MLKCAIGVLFAVMFVLALFQINVDALVWIGLFVVESCLLFIWLLKKCIVKKTIIISKEEIRIE